MTTKSMKSIGLAFFLILSVSAPYSTKPIAPVPSSIYTMNLDQINSVERALQSISITLSLANESKQKRTDLYQEFIKMALQDYSELMKILCPHDTASSYTFNEIDPIWLAGINANLQRQKDFLNRSQKDDSLPTFSQSLLLETEKKTLEKPNIVIGLSTNSGSHQIKSLLNFAGTSSTSASDSYNQKDTINVNSSPNLDQRLFILYHEFGHAVNDDIFNQIAIEDGKKNYADFFNNDPRILQIDHYTKLGIDLIDNSSNIGSTLQRTILRALTYQRLGNLILALTAPVKIPAKYIYAVIANKKTIHYSDFFDILKEFVEGFWSTSFWIPPTNAMTLSKYTYLRSTEKCADLFALEHLYERNFINAILRWVEYIISCGKDNNELCPTDAQYIISTDIDDDGKQDEHPSDIERAVYALGFLAAHGIDINKALRDYEAHGQCIDGESIKAVVDHLQSKKCPATSNA